METCLFLFFRHSRRTYSCTFLNHLSSSCSGPHRADDAYLDWTWLYPPLSHCALGFKSVTNTLDTHIHTHNHTYNLELPFHLTCLSVDRKRDMVHLQETDTEKKTCTPWCLVRQGSELEKEKRLFISKIFHISTPLP